MPRRRVDIRPAGARTERSGRDGIWEAIRKLRQFTVGDLERETRENQGTIRTYIRGLQHADYIRSAGKDESRIGTIGHSVTAFKPTIYELINDVGVEAPRVTRNGETVTQGAAREQMWRTMRAIKTFTHRELAITASTEEQPVREGDAKDYCRYLRLAGYLRVAKPGGPGRLTVYRFVPAMDTGPKPPMVQRVRQVYDPNRQAVVWRRGES